MWWHTVTSGRGSEGETGEWSGQPVPFTLPRNMVYPALLPLMRTPRLPVVDWTDAPPGRFKWTCPFRRKTKSGFCACAVAFQTQSNNGYCPEYPYKMVTKWPAFYRHPRVAFFVSLSLWYALFDPQWLRLILRYANWLFVHFRILRDSVRCMLLTYTDICVVITISNGFYKT